MMVQETLPYHNYVVREVRPSKIDPDATIDVEVEMRCPRCKHAQPIMKHAEMRKCETCGLSMVLHGNALSCTG